MLQESNNVCIAKKSAWLLLIYTYNTLKGKIAIRILPIGKNIRVAPSYTTNIEIGFYIKDCNYICRHRYIYIDVDYEFELKLLFVFIWAVQNISQINHISQSLTCIYMFDWHMKYAYYRPTMIKYKPIMLKVFFNN